MLCVSQASSAIGLSMDNDEASSSSSNGELGGRTIDRHNPIIRDGRRWSQPPPPLDPTKKVSSKSEWKRKSGTRNSPPGSSRYLLGDANNNNTQDLFAHTSSSSLASCSSSSYSHDQSHSKLKQVVVLRVSLHCKGCEGKVRKHLSRMEGVTSFNIDFAAKKVTVVGDVSPVSVLASISKVKNAQILTSSLPMPSVL